MAVTIGTEVTTGTSVFDTLGTAIGYLPALAIGTAAVAITIVCIRYAASPTPDNLENAKAQILRILIISAFFAALGGIVSWVCSGMGGAPAGLSEIISGL